MPILNLTLQGEARRPDGHTIPLPPHIVLSGRGPIVEVNIRVAETIARPVVQAGGAIPAPITGLALIDTGASGTCVDDDAAVRLQLPVVGVAKMASATHDESLRNQYPIQIDFVGWGVQLNVNRAMGASLKAQGLVALIGRDMLQRCILVYNGPAGSFSLAL